MNNNAKIRVARDKGGRPELTDSCNSARTSSRGRTGDQRASKISCNGLGPKGNESSPRVAAEAALRRQNYRKKAKPR